MTWLVPREDLTPGQLSTVDLPIDRHRLILGAPGSGKTLVLVHRAHHLLDELGIRPDRLRIFVFTNVLKEYIRSALDLLGIAADSVTTFDSWCKSCYQDFVDRNVPTAERHQPDYERITDGVLQFLRRSRPAPFFDAVFVDEAQDLRPEALEVIRLISKHATLCADRRQQIYDNGSEERQIAAVFGIERGATTLLDAFRCSPYIVQLASTFCESEDDRRALLAQVRTEPGEREVPLLVQARSFEEERARLFDVLRTRLLKGESVGVLLPTRRQMFGFAQGLRESGFDVETQRSWARGEAPDFASDRPKLLTYHSAKGLTFNTVMLPRVSRASFGRSLADARIRRMLFVAITRATNWVYVSTDANHGFGPLEHLIEHGRASRSIDVQGERSQPGFF